MLLISVEHNADMTYIKLHNKIEIPVFNLVSLRILVRAITRFSFNTISNYKPIYHTFRHLKRSLIISRHLKNPSPVASTLRGFVSPFIYQSFCIGS